MSDREPVIPSNARLDDNGNVAQPDAAPEMNRLCRRKHQKHWKVKEFGDGVRRVVICMKCGGTETQFKTRGYTGA